MLVSDQRRLPGTNLIPLRRKCISSSLQISTVSIQRKMIAYSSRHFLVANSLAPPSKKATVLCLEISSISFLLTLRPFLPLPSWSTHFSHRVSPSLYGGWECMLIRLSSSSHAPHFLLFIEAAQWLPQACSLDSWHLSAVKTCPDVINTISVCLAVGYT